MLFLKLADLIHAQMQVQ